MTISVRSWWVLSALLGVGLLFGAWQLVANGELPPYELPAVSIARWSAAGLLAVVVVLVVGRRVLHPVFAEPPEDDAPPLHRRHQTLNPAPF